jgi:hypothetical protein
MANSKISALTSATTPLAGTETLPVVQSNTTKQVSVANLTAGRQVDMLYLNVSTSAGLVGNVNSTNANGGYLRWQTNGTSIWDIGSAKQVFGTGTANDGGFATRAGYYLGLGANGNETIRLTTDGNATVVQAAKGVNFTANTPASGMTSQLLNWYEEGTWTPNFSTWTVAPTVILTGRYIRIGRQVTLTMYCTGGTATAASVISGIPFTGASNSASPGIAISDNTNAIAFAGTVEQNGTTINRLGAATLTGIYWKFILTYFCA